VTCWNNLYAEGINIVYIGDLTDVLDTHWSVESNAKTQNFWAFKKFTERLVCAAEEYGISVEVRSEAWTSQECPQYGSTDRTTRHQDTLIVWVRGAYRLTASETLLKRYTEQTVRPMARSVRFEWNDHDWSGTPHLTSVAKNSAQTWVPSTVTGMLLPASLRPAETPTKRTPFFT